MLTSKPSQAPAVAVNNTAPAIVNATVQATVSNTNSAAFVSAGMPLPVIAKPYIVEWHVMVTSAAAATGGIKFQIVGPAGMNGLYSVYGTNLSTTAWAAATYASGSPSGAFCAFDCSGATPGGLVIIRANLPGNTAAGTFDLQFAPGTNGQSYGVFIISSGIAYLRQN